MGRPGPADRAQGGGQPQAGRGYGDHRRLAQQPPGDAAQGAAAGPQQREFGAAPVGGEAAGHEQDHGGDRAGAEDGHGDQRADGGAQPRVLGEHVVEGGVRLRGRGGGRARLPEERARRQGGDGRRQPGQVVAVQTGGGRGQPPVPLREAGRAQHRRGGARCQQQRADPVLAALRVVGDGLQARTAQQGIGRPVRLPGGERVDDAGDPHRERGVPQTGDVEDRSHLDAQFPGRLGADGGLDRPRRRGDGARRLGQAARPQPGVVGEPVLRDEREARGQGVRPGQSGVGDHQFLGGAHAVGGLLRIEGEGPAGRREERGVGVAQRLRAQRRLQPVPSLRLRGEVGHRGEQAHGGAFGPGRVQGPAQPRVVVPVDRERQRGGQERGHRDQQRQGRRGAGSGPQPGAHPGGGHPPLSRSPDGHLTHLPVPAATPRSPRGAAPVPP